MLYLHGKIETRLVCQSVWMQRGFNSFPFLRMTETHAESITLALYLHTLVSFTSPNTWALLKQKNLAPLKPGMIQLCSNIMGSLVQKGFFLSLRVSRVNFLEKTKKIVYSFRLISGDSIERNVPNDCHTEANLTESNSIAISATINIVPLLRKSYDNVSGAYSLDAGTNLSNGNAGARMHSNAAIARDTPAHAWNSRKRSINEDHHKQYEGNAIIGTVSECHPFILFGADRVGAGIGFSHIHGEDFD